MFDQTLVQKCSDIRSFYLEILLHAVCVFFFLINSDNIRNGWTPCLTKLKFARTNTSFGRKMSDVRPLFQALGWAITDAVSLLLLTAS